MLRALVRSSWRAVNLLFLEASRAIVSKGFIVFVGVLAWKFCMSRDGIQVGGDEVLEGHLARRMVNGCVEHKSRYGVRGLFAQPERRKVSEYL